MKFVKILIFVALMIDLYSLKRFQSKLIGPKLSCDECWADNLCCSNNKGVYCDPRSSNLKKQSCPTGYKKLGWISDGLIFHKQVGQ